MAIDDAIAEGLKCVINDVVALGGFGPKETAPKPFDINLRFKVRAARKASANHRPSFSTFLLRPKIEYQMAAV